MPLSPPHLSDKLIDWKLIENAGGQNLLAGKDVIDFGPSFGLDMITWSFFTKSYTVVESAPDVLVHIRAMRRLFPERDITVYEHNLQIPLGYPDTSFDVVIDFGTVDNLIKGYAPFEEAWRLLRYGGYLFTTFANLNFFKTPISDCGDEHRFDPIDLRALFYTLGGRYVTHSGDDQPRAGLVVQKVSEPIAPIPETPP